MVLTVFTSILRGPPRLTHWEIGRHAMVAISRLVLLLAGLGATLVLVSLVLLMVFR